MYPDKTPKEREYLITKEKKAVCLMQIGDKLGNGEPHDGRAPDYDDWHSTPIFLSTIQFLILLLSFPPWYSC